MRKKTLAVVCSAVLAMSALAGCQSSKASGSAAQAGAQSEASDSASEEADAGDSRTADAAQNRDEGTLPEDVKGSISMVGSTSMEKFANALSEVFMEKYPNVTLQAEFVGSGAGVEAVAGGSADIGNASRSLKEEEKAIGRAHV